MLKLILVHLLLFAGFLLVFILLAAGIQYAWGSGKHTIITALVYIALVVTHLLINHRLLKKWQPASPEKTLVSMILIACLYMIYLIYLLTN